MQGKFISHNLGPQWTNTPSYCDFLGFSYILFAGISEGTMGGAGGGGKDQGDETEGLERGGIK